MEPKAQKRASILLQRRQLTPAFCSAASAQAAGAFCLLEEYRSAGAIGLYAPFDNEVSTEPIFRDAVRHSKKVFFPKTDAVRKNISFFRVRDLAEMTPGYAGILEPAKTEKGELDAMELLVIPGLAFDLKGNRLGYGLGFYDRLLEKYHGCKIALAYEFQLSDSLPTSSTDVAVDIIVTEERVVRVLH